ncbi:MAG TPA: ATP cone domain-containing protein [Patescibacteria group bacterium]|nr:ATP cone domain-containing protein [Patescibacteria group bacterium]
MNCPFCRSSQVFVTNSRPTKGNTQIWRRRKCSNCKKLFTTYENIDLSYLIVIKKSGRRQRYDRAKLYSSIYHAAIQEKGSDRGETGNLAEEITKDVETEILSLKRKRIKTSEIFNIVFDILKKKHLSTSLRYLAYFQKPSNLLSLRKLLF